MFSDWTEYWHKPLKSYHDVRIVLCLLTTPLLDRSRFITEHGFAYKRLDREVEFTFAEKDLVNNQARLDAIRLMFDSYVYMIEEMPGDDVLKVLEFEDTRISKQQLMKSIDEIESWGLNPFDVLYYTSTKRYRTQERIPVNIGHVLVMSLLIGGVIAFVDNHIWFGAFVFFVISVTYLKWALPRRRS